MECSFLVLGGEGYNGNTEPNHACGGPIDAGAAINELAHEYYPKFREFWEIEDAPCLHSSERAANICVRTA